MPKISARDAQVFVAGAFAFEGLHALLRLPYTVAADIGLLLVISEVVGAFGLPLGIAIAIRNILAVRVAIVYLGLDVLIEGASLVLILYKPQIAIDRDIFVRDVVIILVSQAVLLTLLLWSQRPQRSAVKAVP